MPLFHLSTTLPGFGAVHSQFTRSSLYFVQISGFGLEFRYPTHVSGGVLVVGNDVAKWGDVSTDLTTSFRNALSHKRNLELEYKKAVSGEVLVASR